MILYLFGFFLLTFLVPRHININTYLLYLSLYDSFKITLTMLLLTLWLLKTAYDFLAVIFLPYCINHLLSLFSVWLNHYPQGAILKKFWFIICWLFIIIYTPPLFSNKNLHTLCTILSYLCVCWLVCFAKVYVLESSS